MLVGIDIMLTNQFQTHLQHSDLTTSLMFVKNSMKPSLGKKEFSAEQQNRIFILNESLKDYQKKTLKLCFVMKNHLPCNP
jgi:hypothetical protein